MNRTMRRMYVITGALWGLALLVFVVGWANDDRHLELLAFLIGLAGVSTTVAASIRWSCQVLVHVMALYNDDLPTPEGAKMINDLVPPPKHAIRPLGMDGAAADGDGVR